MYGIVKSVVGGRVMVDFNNQLAGKNIKFEYNIVEIVNNIKEKIIFVLKNVLKLPTTIFKVDIKEKDITISVPEELEKMQDALKKTFGEFINEINNYNIKIEKFKKEKSYNLFI
jgi:peptidylprolyl isomerase